MSEVENFCTHLIEALLGAGSCHRGHHNFPVVICLSQGSMHVRQHTALPQLSRRIKSNTLCIDSEETVRDRSKHNRYCCA